MVETLIELAARLRAAHEAFLKTPAGEDWLKRVEYLRETLGTVTDAGLSLTLMSSLVGAISAADAFEIGVDAEGAKQNPAVARILYSVSHRLMVVAEKMGDDHLVSAALPQAGIEEGLHEGPAFDAADDRYG